MGLDNPLHIIFLVVILLLVFGAKRIPEIGRSLGAGMMEFKDAVSGASKPGIAPAAEQPAAAPAAVPEFEQPVAQPAPAPAAAPAQAPEPASAEPQPEPQHQA